MGSEESAGEEVARGTNGDVQMDELCLGSHNNQTLHFCKNVLIKNKHDSFLNALKYNIVHNS